MRRVLPLGLLVALTGAPACAPGPGARAAFIQEVLVRDNRVWLTREPALVADKFAAMSSDLYRFMRGTAALHFADLARPDAARARTAFLDDPEATTVLLFGDPHPENATVCRADPSTDEPDPAPTVEFVDLDTAGFGPWTLDLRRAALGLRTLADGLDGCDAACVDPAVDALAGAYALEILGETPEDTDWGEILEDLIDEALEEGAENKRTDKYTEVPTAGGRRFLRADGPSVADSYLLGLDRFEQDLVDGLMTEWRTTDAAPGGFRVLDAARRYGSSVTSRAAIRFVIAYDRGSDGPEDDAIMQVREVVDPPALPGRAVRTPGAFEDNGQRVWTAARRLWSRPDADPRNGHATALGLTFKSLSWTSWFQDVDHEKIADAWADGDYGPEQLEGLAADLGRVLAASHARGGTLTGGDAGAAITRDLRSGGGPAALVAEVQAHSAADFAQLQVDAGLFARLLEDEGPLLGADRILTEPR